jgi:hypothetical protein
MPRQNSLISRLRHGRAWDEWDEKGDEETKPPVASAEVSSRRSGTRRVAAALTFAALFVAGAAFSATAGDQVRSALEASAMPGQASTDATATDATTDPGTSTSTDPAPAPAADPVDGGGATVTAPTPAPADGGATAVPPADTTPVTAPAASATAQAAVQQAASGSASSAAQANASTAAAQPEPAPAASAPPADTSARAEKKQTPAPVELEGAASSVVWLNRAMPDPTPPALRLRPPFAQNLRSVARANHVSWALLLGVLRVQGNNGAAPASLPALRMLAGRLARQGVQTPWAATFAVSGETSFADRAVALSHYYRGVGLRALVRGLEAEKTRLGKKVLNDPRVTIYAAGRGDIESGRVDVRVLASIEYLADSFGQVTVSCLISGHRLYARPGVISAHIYGLAADISEVGGTPIYGHQQPGGITERAVRDVLLLPPEVMPKQVISLLGLGGPSFALANHYDHIHIGF